MNCKKSDLLLYAVTDRNLLRGKDLLTQVKEALLGGITFLQLREKGLAQEELFNEALQVKELCRKFQVPLIINDDVGITLRADADGVHLGQQDMDAGEARKILGPDKIIGVSAHNVEEAVRAMKHGADYLGVGAAFSTSTKKDASAISHETIREICKAVTIPVVAIGGINGENMRELEGTGICGIAVVSAVFGADDITEAARKLRLKAKNLFV